MVFKNCEKLEDEDKELHYVATTHKETADLLRRLGFKEIENDGNRVVFLNNIKNMEA